MKWLGDNWHRLAALFLLSVIAGSSCVTATVAVSWTYAVWHTVQSLRKDIQNNATEFEEQLSRKADRLEQRAALQPKEVQ